MKNILHADCGSILVEAAIILPVLLLLVLGGLDLGLGMVASLRLNFAVEAASRCGAIGATPCPDQGSTAQYAAQAAGVPVDAFTVTKVACGILVSASYQFQPTILPAFDLSATACYPTAPVTS